MAAVLNSYLVVTALGPDKPNVVHQLTNSLTNCGGNILDTRMTSLGSEFGIMLLIEGSWGAIAKIEANLFILEERSGLTINVRRTTPKLPRLKTISYMVHTVTIDREGIINDLVKFFNSQNIAIEDVNAHTYLAHTGTRMSTITMNVNISLNTHIPTLREQFMLYCDALNLDASLEPLRD